MLSPNLYLRYVGFPWWQNSYFWWMELKCSLYAIYRWRTCGKDNDSAEYHLPKKLASIHWNKKAEEKCLHIFVLNFLNLWRRAYLSRKIEAHISFYKKNSQSWITSFVWIILPSSHGQSLTQLKINNFSIPEFIE